MGAGSAIRAVVLDFDGLVLDTESCVYEAWRLVYEEYGHELPLDRWCAAIGADTRTFDPLAELRARVGASLDVGEMHDRRRRHRDAMLDRMEPMPGVASCLFEARARGLGVGIASSSPRPWVHGHLVRLGLRHYFDAMATEEDVASVKPSPELYLRAIDSLGVASSEAIAIEDSPNGVASAKAAGLYCIAVPGPMTRHLAFDDADVVLDSLADRPLSALIARAACGRA